jgi:hypothetical protein
VTYNFADEFNSFIRQIANRHDEMKVVNHVP